MKKVSAFKGILAITTISALFSVSAQAGSSGSGNGGLMKEMMNEKYQVQPVTDAASQAALRKVVIAGSSGNGGLMKEMSPVHKEVHIDPAAQSHLDSVVIPSGD